MSPASAPTKQITVATANTYFGQMIRAPHGLDPIEQADVLLLQEVFLPEDELKLYLHKAGFKLIHLAHQFSLAIALKNRSTFQYVPGSAKEHRLAKMSIAERLAIKKITPTHSIWSERGLISCTLISNQGRKIAVATTHPATPVQPRTRHKQIIRLRQLLEEYYSEDNLIIGGDMNHYPRPRKVDRKLHAATLLTPVILGIEPTWRVRGSKQEKLLQIAATITHRTLESFDGQHDIILYREGPFILRSVKIVDIVSDHRAIIAEFAIN